MGQGYRSCRVPLSEAKLVHLGWHYLLAHPLCIWRSQNTTKLIYWLKRVEETLGCILFATGWMNSQKHIKCWTTIKLMKFLLSEFDITLLNLNEVCIQFYLLQSITTAMDICFKNKIVSVSQLSKKQRIQPIFFLDI